MRDLPPPESNGNSLLPRVDRSEAGGLDHVEWAEQVPEVGQAPMKPGLRGAIAIGWIAVAVGVIALWCGTEQGWMDAATWTWAGLLGGGPVAFVIAVIAVKAKRPMQAFPLFLASAVLLALPVLIFVGVGGGYAAMGGGG